jgi:ribosomal-protein-alanine N-acetyltransferase
MLALPIVTPRLRLDALADGDLDGVFAILGDEATTAQVSWGQPSREAAAGWLKKRQYAQREYGLSMLAIRDRATAVVVGLCGFFPRGEPQLELGYVVHARHWGCGYATEAVGALLAALPDVAVHATIRPSNTASLRVAAKVGLAESGQLRDHRGTLIVYTNTCAAANTPVQPDGTAAADRLER